MDNTQYYPIVFDDGGKFLVINNGTAPPCINYPKG